MAGWAGSLAHFLPRQDVDYYPGTLKPIPRPFPEGLFWFINLMNLDHSYVTLLEYLPDIRGRKTTVAAKWYDYFAPIP